MSPLRRVSIFCLSLVFIEAISLQSCKQRQLELGSTAKKTASRRKTPPSPPGLKALAEIPVVQDPVSPQCANPPNAIIAENCLPGQPPSVWDVPTNDPANNGFTMRYSYAPGETVDFKMRSTRGVTLKIFRMGYYRGLGGRLIATVQPTTAGAITQPDCVKELPMHFVHCDNWATSAQWQIPVNQVSGVYMAKMEFSDGTGGSLIPFLVRNESRAADILLQTSDANWQAYNWFGGISTYEREGFQPPADGEPGMSPKASYLRPLAADASLPGSSRNWHFNFFGDHYPAIRWFEKHGYNVNYIACKDTANPLKLPYLKAHKAFVSLGHDEYWSQSSRDHIQQARDNKSAPWATGTSLIFMSGNTMFEKIRWEDQFQTLVTYKQSRLLDWPSDPGTVGDPNLNTDQTGYFRDGRFRHLGQKPENEIMGLLYTTLNNVFYPVTVPASYARHRFWRNTTVATLTGTQIYKSPSPYMLGYELDEDVDNGYRPSGLMHLSSTNISGVIREISVYGSGMDLQSGNLDHHMSLYRAPSGAYVWATGSIFFAFALDSFHERSHVGVEVGDKQIQQATVNMLADMKIHSPGLIAPLRPATSTTDFTPPSSAITSLRPTGSKLISGKEHEIRGTASDQSGSVGGVEISTDGGATWHPTDGTSQWSYRWIPRTFGPVVIKTRAVDDSGNLENPGAGVQAQVVSQGNFWNRQNLGSLPGVYRAGWHELGFRFQADTDGIVRSISFYKNHADGKTYPVRLWDDSGTVIAQGSANVSSAARGWITVPLSAPASIQKGRVYTASYRTDGYFAYRPEYMNPNRRLYIHPLKELGSAFSQGSYLTPQAGYPVIQHPGMTYFVDIDFAATDRQSPRVSLFNDDTSPQVVGTYTASTTDRELGVRFRVQSDGYVHGVRFYKDQRNNGPHTISLWRRLEDNASGNVDPTRTDYTSLFRMAWSTATQESASGWQNVYFDQPIFMSAGQTYIASYRSKTGYQSAPATDLPQNRRYNAPLEFVSGIWSLDSYPANISADQNGVDVIFEPTAPKRNTVYTASTSPQVEYAIDVAAGKIVPYELGTRFVSETDGYVTGVRFFVGKASAGPHSVRLWLNSRTSAPLATATASATAFGWVEAAFATPVRILAGRVYSASFSTQTGFSLSRYYFAHPYGSLTPPLRFTGAALPPLTDPFPATPAAEPSGPNGVVSKTMGAYPGNWGWNNYYVEPVFTTQLSDSASTASASCGPTTIGASCGTNQRCDSLGQCVTCSSWCASGAECYTGSNVCSGTTGAPVCAITPAAAGSFCRTGHGELGKCDGAGICGVASVDL